MKRRAYWRRSQRDHSLLAADTKHPAPRSVRRFDHVRLARLIRSDLGEHGLQRVEAEEVNAVRVGAQRRQGRARVVAADAGQAKPRPQGSRHLLDLLWRDQNARQLWGAVRDAGPKTTPTDGTPPCVRCC